MPQVSCSITSAVSLSIIIYTPWETGSWKPSATRHLMLSFSDSLEVYGQTGPTDLLTEFQRHAADTISHHTFPSLLLGTSPMSGRAATRLGRDTHRLVNERYRLRSTIGQRLITRAFRSQLR